MSSQMTYSSAAAIVSGVYLQRVLAPAENADIPVEGENPHAAAVIAQTGVHPCLGKDNIDLVLLRREE